MSIPNLVSVLIPIIHRVHSIHLISQLYKSYKTKGIKDLSLFSLLLILFSSLIILIHGYFNMDYFIIITELISVFIIINLLIIYFLYRKK